MQVWQCFLGVSVMVIGLAPSAEANETYDNPLRGEAPCLVLNGYQASGNGDRFGAVANVENICGRSVEVSFCFPFVEPVDDVDRACQNGVVRPWATSTVAISDQPAKLTGPDYQWRYLP